MLSRFSNLCRHPQVAGMIPSRARVHLAEASCENFDSNTTSDLLHQFSTPVLGEERASDTMKEMVRDQSQLDKPNCPVLFHPHRPRSHDRRVKGEKTARRHVHMPNQLPHKADRHPTPETASRVSCKAPNRQRLDPDSSFCFLMGCLHVSSEQGRQWANRWASEPRSGS